MYILYVYLIRTYSKVEKCDILTYGGANAKGKRLSAPEGVPRPSPILVLAGPYHTFLRRSDGIRGFHDSMADNEVNSGMFCVLSRLYWYLLNKCKQHKERI